MYQRLLIFSHLDVEHSVGLQVANRGCHAQFSSATRLATLQVAGNAAHVFVRRRDRLKPPGTGYTGFDEGRRGNEKTVGIQVSFAGETVPGIPDGSTRPNNLRWENTYQSNW